MIERFGKRYARLWCEHPHLCGLSMVAAAAALYFWLIYIGVPHP